jgi:hypothetical protein
VLAFTGIYLALTVAVAGGGYYLMRQAAEQQLIDVGDSANRAMARGLTQTLWPSYGNYIQTVTDTSGDVLRARPETAQIHAAVRQAVADLPILKLKMFNKSGLTVYSSQADQIGDSKHQNNSFLSVAKHGVSGSKTSQRPTFNGFYGQVRDVVLVETYAPILNAGKQVEGVFELYTDVTEAAQGMQQRIQEAVWLLLAVLAVGYALLLAVLNAALNRSDEHYRKQLAVTPDAEELVRVNESLEKQNAHLKHRLQSMQSYIADRSAQELAE